MIKLTFSKFEMRMRCRDTLFMMYLLLAIELLSACAPGRSGMKRRPGRRKLIPFIFKQYDPPHPENSYLSSGPVEQVITRETESFKHKLVRNTNPQIQFKDEEGTGADYYMSKWPRVRLRITEAWDEDFRHKKHSLHYEGRAVDLTTSDRDRSKYGLLARLAREAGFDWVYYESRSHVHASVKSDEAIDKFWNGCFSNDGRVELETGEIKQLKDLKVGDKVLASTQDGSPTYSTVYMFIHRDIETQAEFLGIETVDGVRLHVTSNHLIPVVSSNASSYTDTSVVFAGDLSTSHYILIMKNSISKWSQIKTVSLSKETGVIAPLTLEGTIVVDGVLASCYAEFQNHLLSHLSLYPLRQLYAWNMLTFLQTTDMKFNAYWYANFLHTIVKQFSPNMLFSVR